MNSIEALAPAFIIGFFVAGLALERLAPGRPLPESRGWYAKTGLCFFVTMAISALLPMLFVETVRGFAPFDLRGLGTLGGAAIALVAIDLASYILHRSQHESSWLWRWTHQMHHSAERVDVMGAAYFHPFDIGAQTVVSTLVSALLGVTPEAAALAGLVLVFLGVFQHLNVRTPRALGLLVQRPESHSVHHERGVHAFNYGNLSLWDLAFGTFRNPGEFAAEAGFWDGASSRVGKILLGVDVGQAPQRGESGLAPFVKDAAREPGRSTIAS